MKANPWVGFLFAKKVPDLFFDRYRKSAQAAKINPAPYF